MGWAATADEDRAPGPGSPAPMAPRDEERLADCRARGESAVLFSRKPDWNRRIGQVLELYVPFCQSFSEVDPARFDLVVPLAHRDALVLSERYRHLHGRNALVTATEVIALCNDKRALADRLAALGFRHVLPRTRDLHGFPYVWKKRVGAFGEGTVIIEDAAGERRHRTASSADTHFAQEYVPGHEEYACHAICADGRIVFHREVKSSFPPGCFVKGRGCPPRQQQPIDHSRHVRLFEEILGAIGYEGICCLDYKLDGGEVKLLEINPRYGASLTFFINEALPAYEAALSSAVRVGDRPGTAAPGGAEGYGPTAGT